MIWFFCDDNNTLSKLTDTIELEHILPQKHTSWGKEIFHNGKTLNDFIDKNHDKHNKDAKSVCGYLDRLGKCTILTDGKNKKVTNKIYSSKLPNIKKDPILLNVEVDDLKELAVSHYKEWTTESINKRQQKMAEYAEKIWTF